MFAFITFYCLLSTAQGQTQQPPELRAEVRREIQAAYTVWGKARLAFDNSIYEKMLAPDFYAQLPQK
jgi:hypothetical protein